MDTDFLVGLLRNDLRAIDYLKKLIKSPSDLNITHVTLWELYQGVYKSSKPDTSLKQTEELLEFFNVIPFTQGIARRFGHLANDLKRHGTPVGVMDTLIASVALENNLSIVTRNRKHYEKTGVQIIDW
ncbi:MAG: type II toxin-antitoxin system VapC family toxin [Candidatus Hodarchaeales archaeon]